MNLPGRRKGAETIRQVGSIAAREAKLNQGTLIEGTYDVIERKLRERQLAEHEAKQRTKSAVAQRKPRDGSGKFLNTIENLYEPGDLVCSRCKQSVVAVTYDANRDPVCFECEGSQLVTPTRTAVCHGCGGTGYIVLADRPEPIAI
jgi:hypothetical protein